MRFAVFTHVIHHRQNDLFYAYPPYVREMNIWLQNFESIEIVAPLEAKKPDNEIVYQHKNLIFNQISGFNLLSFGAILRSLIVIPIIFLKIIAAMRRADHLHIRCPGNIGLLACIAQIFFPKKPKTVKYAGNWDPDAAQPLSYKLQKKILNSTFLSKNIKVLVYGTWAGMSGNIVPFFTASFSEKEEEEIIEKDFSGKLNFVFIGNLTEGKQPVLALKLVEALRNKNYPVNLEFYGTGEMQERLQEYISERKLADFVSLKGKVDLEILKSVYKQSHFVILPSKSEGWPKALAEGMFFGCVPIASSVSCIPWMFKAPSAPKGGTRKTRIAKRGILMPIGTFKHNENALLIEETVQVISELIQDGEKLKKLSFEAQVWSREYTLEKFENAVKQLLKS